MARTPKNELKRLVALRSYEILDTPREAAYDDIVRLAANICATPISFISFIDEKRQWFKSEIGLGMREAPLEEYGGAQEGPLVVSNACSWDPNIRFQAGALLRTQAGFALGTLCVLDYVPRELTEAQKDALVTLSRQVMAQLELHRNLKALRSSDQLARSVIDSTPDWVTVLDLDGRLLSMNGAGQNQMQIVDFEQYRFTDWTEFWDGADREAARAAIAEARAGAKAQFQGFCPSVKGEPRWWEVIVTPILDSSGRAAKLLCLSREISARRRLEQQMRETAKLESLGVMASGLAHDFNNLLTGILGNASILMDSVGGEEREMANDIATAAERAAELTRQMLAYSGKGKFESKRIHLSSLVREILRLVQPSFEKTVQVSLELEEDLPEIEGDPAQMQQLVMNLTINAAEALERRAGRVTIATRSRAGASAVLLEVSDTGVGMTEETKARIFDPFFTTKFTGRGLGLAAVSGIVRGHRGTMDVQTRPGRGTSFTVLLPAAATPRPDAEPEPDWADLRGRGTILLVDDEEMVRRVGKSSLEHSGYEVLLADHGQHAMEVFAERAGEISLVVLDMMMPVMSGEDALTRLNAIGPQVPIVVSSGYSEAEVTRRFTSGGGNIAGFLQKPYSASQLARKVKEVLMDCKTMRANG